MGLTSTGIKFNVIDILHSQKYTVFDLNKLN